MTGPTDIADIVARYTAIDVALNAADGARRPRFARQCAAMVALSASGEPAVVADRIRACAWALHGARGVTGEVRPVFAAALATAHRSADDYVAAREGLLPALEGRRKSLPAAALTYAIAGRTVVSDTERARILDLAPLVAAPWWSAASAWNGFYAAVFALTGLETSEIERRLDATRRALADAGAHDGVVRDEGRRLALRAEDAGAAAHAWRRLDDARRDGRLGGRYSQGALVAYAASAAGQAGDAVETLGQARSAVDDVRPRPHSLIRPFLAVGLARLTLLTPADRPDVQDAVEAALLVIQANEAAMAIAASSAAIAATSS
jgi:hypothetical protein